MMTIDALVPVTRRELLRLTYGQPERWWYLSELAVEIATSPSSLQRELESLVAAGLLEKRAEGRRTYYRPNRDNAIFRELHSIVKKTMGISQEIRVALRPVEGRILVAFLYGSVARGKERASSDIDLFVVGEVGLSDLAPIAARLEPRLGREINITVMTSAELRKRRKSQDHFLEDVLRREKEFLIAGEAELAAIAG